MLTGLLVVTALSPLARHHVHGRGRRHRASLSSWPSFGCPIRMHKPDPEGRPQHKRGDPATALTPAPAPGWSPGANLARMEVRASCVLVLMLGPTSMRHLDIKGQAAGQPSDENAAV